MLDRFSKYTQISNLLKMRPVGAELFHADGQPDARTDRETDGRTNMTELCVNDQRDAQYL